MTPTKAKKIVEAIVKDLTDRNGLEQAWDDIDSDTAAEIRATWAKIVLNVEAKP